MNKPELLSPAGDMEKLKYAFAYGADAVYLGAEEYGMRAAPKNFTLEQLKEAVDFANSLGKKVYLTLNTVPTNDEVDKMPEFIKKIGEIGVHAVIVADMGVMQMVKENAPNVDIHMSTQTGIMNYRSANALYALGARRVVLARECSFEDIIKIRRNTPKDLEIECFVHGAMCMSFSGRCLLSHYLTGRDANRGECAQPCRWEYRLVEKSRPGMAYDINESPTGGTYIMTANDLCMAQYIDMLVDAGITSLKIEGRAQSFYYVASVTSAYRKAIDSYFANPVDWICPNEVTEELCKTSHRRYSTGFYFGPEHAIQSTDTSQYVREYELLGVVDECKDNILYCEQRGKFNLGDEIEILSPKGENIVFKPKWIKNADGEFVQSTPHSKMRYTIPCEHNIEPMSVIRKKL